MHDRADGHLERLMALKVIVIVATAGRKEISDRLLQHLENQTNPPDEVIVSAPDPSHVGTYQTKHFPTSHVFGTMGSTAQRNLGLASALGRCDVITFFDDDFLPADDYLEQLKSGFEGNHDWTVVMGRTIHD